MDSKVTFLNLSKALFGIRESVNQNKSVIHRLGRFVPDKTDTKEADVLFQLRVLPDGNGEDQKLCLSVLVNEPGKLSTAIWDTSLKKVTLGWIVQNKEDGKNGTKSGSVELDCGEVIDVDIQSSKSEQAYSGIYRTHVLYLQRWIAERFQQDIIIP